MSDARLQAELTQRHFGDPIWSVQLVDRRSIQGPHGKGTLNGEIEVVSGYIE